MKHKQSPLLKYILELEKKAIGDEIILYDIAQTFGSKGHFVFILFLILPFLQPIPLFGLSTPFGILISLVAFYSFFNRPLRLPKKWAKKKLKKDTILKIAHGSDFFFKLVGRFFKPRIQFLFSGPFNIINILIIIINAVLLALPLPIPFSNAIPAWVILFQALGNIEKDGLLILISYLQMLVCMIFFLLIFYGAIWGFDFIKYLLK